MKMKMISLNNYCVLSVLVSLFKIQVETVGTTIKDPLPLDETYYENCAPVVSCDENNKYRTANGSCNNALNPLWGSTITPHIRLAPANYDDGDHEIRLQSNGNKLPGPRELQKAIFLSKSFDVPDVRNFHWDQVGQWVTHDISLMLPDDSGSNDCCAVQNSSTVPPQCQAVIHIDENDPIYSTIGKTCIPFVRALTTNKDLNCIIKPQISVNRASAFIDASQVYGHTDNVAAQLRVNTGGRLKTDMINGQEFCTQQERTNKICEGRDNVNVCFNQGDPRSNQHYGLVVYNAIFTRFHNYLVDELVKLNPSWTDEILYQEARKIIGAVNQILVYRDYLPVLLGEKYSASVGLTVTRENKTVYNPNIMPQIAVEFTAGCFRVLHNVVPSNYYFLDENNLVTKEVLLSSVMFLPDDIIIGDNFEDVLRGMSKKPGRFPISSYNLMISNFMFHGLLPMNADHDLLSIDIQRGRDIGLPSYTAIRELCGFPKMTTFDDLLDVLSIYDVALLRTLYADVTDVDLLVGALLEPLVEDALVGHTTRCIVTDAFYRLRYGDRFFFDVEDQPGSFSAEQLDVLWSLNIPKIFCGMSTVDELPENFFMADGYSDVLKCESLALDLKAWQSS